MRRLTGSSALGIVYALFATGLFMAIVPNVNEHIYWITSFLTYQCAIGALCATMVYFKYATQRRQSRWMPAHATMLFLIAVILCGFNEAFTVVLISIAMTLIVSARYAAHASYVDNYAGGGCCRATYCSALTGQ